MLNHAPSYSRRLLLPLWLLAGVSLFAFLGTPPCQRAQEARVLVTAREMLVDGGDRWLLPTCNGELRIQKPPLPYWLSAISFAVSGEVSERTGRIPSAFFAWLTVGLIYYAGRRLFSSQAGVLAAGMLLSSYLFFRHGRLAETDIPATFFVSLAIIGCWRGMERCRGKRPDLPAVGWFVASGAAAGLAFMAKGIPGFYALLFAPILAMYTRNWRGMLWFLVIAIVPMALVASPWYLYIILAGKLGVLRDELRVVTGGEDHPGTVLDVCQQMIQATVPWCIFWGIALVRYATFLYGRLLRNDRILAFVPEWGQGDLRPRVVVAWLIAVMVPVLLSGNKQFHYVMPAMPPVMLLGAWVVELAGREEGNRALRTTVRGVAQGTFGVLGLLGLGLVGWGIGLMMGWVQGDQAGLGGSTCILGGITTLVGVAAWVGYLRWGLVRAMGVAVAGMAIVFPILIGPWADALERPDIRTAAAGVQSHQGAGLVVIYRSEQALALSFAMKRVIPVTSSEATLARLAEADGTVLVETKPDAPDASLPAPWQQAWRGGSKGHYFQLYRPAASRGTAASPDHP